MHLQGPSLNVIPLLLTSMFERLGGSPSINPYFNLTNWHWGQRGLYLAGTLWVFWEFLSNLLTLCPAGKLRVLLKLTHHFDLNVIGGYIVIKLKMDPSNYPAGILWMNPPGSFKILIKMYPQCAWATHWEFFQRIPSNLITMYSTIYSMSSLRVCGKIEPHWEFVVSSLKRTHWAHYGHIFGYSLKEISMSGSDTLWVHFDQNCERTQRVHSQNTCWVIWWVHFEFDHNVPTNHIEIKVVSKF